jgi:hypothetical protein
VEFALATETPLDPECHKPEVDGLDEEQFMWAWQDDEDEDEDEDDLYDCEEKGECAVEDEDDLYDSEEKVNVQYTTNPSTTVPFTELQLAMR